MIQTVLVVFLFALSALLLAWRYFRRYAIGRPPIGVFNLWDVGVMLAFILVIPYLYLWLPSWAVGGLLAVSILSISYMTLEPVQSSRWLVWLAVVLICAADVFGLIWFGRTSRANMLVNNFVQVIAVVGISNLWAQSGMKARDCAILGGSLAAYDLFFTSVLSLMDDLFEQLQGLPFAPLVAWSGPNGVWMAIGLGDLLLAAVFPLVMRKAYGLVAGMTAAVIAVSVFAVLLLLPLLDLLHATFPVMILLGPLMVVQYLFWRQRAGAERTTYHYLLAEPRSDNRL